MEYNPKQAQLRKSAPCSAEFRLPRRRMRMNDRLSIRPHLVYKQMHRHFTGSFSVTFHSLAVAVDDDHIFRLDETLIADRRGAHDMAIGKARADVAIGRSNVAFLINEMTETRDLRADFDFRHGRHSIAASGSFGTRTKSKRPSLPAATAQIAAK